MCIGVFSLFNNLGKQEVAALPLEPLARAISRASHLRARYES